MTLKGRVAKLEAEVALLEGLIPDVIPGVLVRITAAQSPYTATAGENVLVDTSAGSVTVRLPVLGFDEGVTVKQDESTSLAVNTVTIQAGAGQVLALPVPNNGTFAGSFTISGVESEGTSLTWFYGGSSGGKLLLE